MANNGINIGLKSYDDLFKTDAERSIEEIKPIPITELKPFEQQPFKVLMDDSMTELVESIKQSGVLSPVVVRPHKDGGYEILSGHRRVKASELAGKTEVPTVIKDLDDETKNRGCICYIRGYFDNSIDERFQSVAMVENKDNYNNLHTVDFQREIDNIINYFRFQSDTPILESLRKMQSVAYDMQPERFVEDKEVCGYRITTEKNVYYFRCDVRQGQYNLYLYAYDKEMLTKYRDLQFVDKNYDEIDKNKFYINNDCAMEMYYNPDANSGGQLVELTFYKEDIKDAARLYKNSDDFFSYLEGMAKGSLYDVGTESFRETAEHFIDSKADFEGETKETMEALKKYAEVTPEKKHKKENLER